MKFSVLAVDYDGTLAAADVLDAEVRAAIRHVRQHGVVVVLATGRILEDLRRVAGDLSFVDAVVAENGAVVEFPATGSSIVNGDPPPAALLAAVTEAGLEVTAGQVVVEGHADDAPRLLEIIRTLELPLALVFNRGRVMVLPQTVSKATGVRQALSILRLSPHNAVAIGDAENDHELLQICEVGVAVAWGSAALQARADYVLPGAGPAAVVGFLRQLADRARVPSPVATRRHLHLGTTTDGRPMSLAVRGRNILVAGDPKSGKSWVTGLLCEQMILYGYSLCVIDPEGDYLSLESLPGVMVLGGADPLPRPRDLMRAMRHADVSTVVDLSHAAHDEKTAYIRSVLPALATMRRHTGHPHAIVVDEAHYFLHDPDGPALLDLELSNYTLVTYRASGLHPDILAASDTILVTRESDPHEVAALYDLCRRSRGSMTETEWEALLAGLDPGEAVVLPITEEAHGEVRRLRLRPRLTPHVRHLAKYIDIPVQEGRAFVFWREGVQTPKRARTLRDFVTVLEQSDPQALADHLQRGDFSRWIIGVFGDHPLGTAVRHIEDEYRRGLVPDVSHALAEAVRARYEFLDPTA